MIGVALCTVEIGVHFVALHEVHEVFFDLDAVGVAIVTLHKPAALHVGVVVDGDTGQVVDSLVQHQVKRGERMEGGIGVFSQDDHFRNATCELTHVKEVAIKFVGHIKNIFGKSPTVDAITRFGVFSVDANQKNGTVLPRGSVKELCLQTVGLEHLFCTVLRGLVNAFPTNHLHLFGEVKIL